MTKTPQFHRVGDQHDKVPAARFPYATFPFEDFNVVQSRLFEFYDQDANVLVAASTSAGKTVVAEMMLSHEVKARGGKGMYLSPLKALANEKLDDWTDPGHHFGKLRTSICTGDYTLTADRRAELEQSDLVVMSSEMLNSKGRNFGSDNNNWMKEVGTLVVDEAHLLTVPGRGDHLESGLLKYAALNPGGRIVLLSATLPNVEEVSRWLSHLTGKDTYLLESTYRPCPLHVHYETYDDSGYTYDDREQAKVWAAMAVLDSYPDDKFLIFVHTKRTGEMVKKTLLKMGVECEYHNADLDKAKRRKVEDRFRTDPRLRVVVATSTLAWGLNLPARRVIVLGVHRGLNEVPVYDIDQMKGRAGRPKYDPAGDAYVLIPESDQANQVARLQKPQRIQSQMYDESNPNHLKVLGFHLVSEIHQGQVKTREDVANWYGSTLAAFQAKELPAAVLDNVLGGLSKCGAIAEEDGQYRATGIGKIASLFYYNPWDVSDLARNLTRVFAAKKGDDDFWVSYALGNIDSHRWNIVSAAEKDQFATYENLLNRHKVREGVNSFATGGSIKASYCYYCLLKGTGNAVLQGMMAGLKSDAGRLKEVLVALDAMACRWGRRDYIKRLYSKILYGVDEKLLGIVKLDGIGKAKAQRLYDHGLDTCEKIAANPDKIMEALSCTKKLAEKIVAQAKALAAAETNA